MGWLGSVEKSYKKSYFTMKEAIMGTELSLKKPYKLLFSNFSCMFLNPNNYFPI